ncbi:hypothetical protein [Bacillus sp. JCM 19034]|uniref:hypothetical protein n=1 Tax=Bacillus sp. JCM 19034 TaxID=1481928 RepID=UPI000781E3D0|nr:hypothetical protein [Bacillus sp. JCM 19034]
MGPAPKRFINRKMKLTLRRSFILLMTILIVCSEALATIPMIAIAEDTGMKNLIVTKDVEGEESKEVLIGRIIPIISLLKCLRMYQAMNL